MAVKTFVFEAMAKSVWSSTLSDAPNFFTP